MKKIIKFIANSIFTIVEKSTLVIPKKYTKNSLVIIRTDAIGDYILFRNFLKNLRQSYDKYHITLIANDIYKEFAMTFDSEFIDKFIWLDKQAFRRNLFYRLKFIYKVSNTRYDCLINPIYSRDYIDLNLAHLIKAGEKIAPKGDCINTKPSAKEKSDCIFTKLLPCKNEILFEFDRNKEFFEHLLDSPLSTKLHINPDLLPDLKNLKNIFGISQPYGVLFIGASDSMRKWDIQNFADIGQYLANKYHQNIVICSGKEDTSIAQNLASQLSGKIHTNIYNLVGKTTLTQLASILKYSHILISNETSAPHIATALDIPCIVISNGNHLYRFNLPYTKIYKNYYLILHPDIQKNLQKYKIISNQHGYKIHLNINDIKYYFLYDIIENILNPLNKKTT